MHRYLVLAIALVAAGAVATVALATPPTHETLTASGTDFAPAGTLCDFDYELEFDVTIQQTRFFDQDGTFVRRLRQVEENLVHRNLDTGVELVETVHYTTDLDVATGLVKLTGNSWHLRDAEGKTVVVRSGLEIFDRFTGEVIRHTPRVGVGFENVICPALGGAPA